MYDAVIIGAGIGGLVCGCTLAKAGMRVLIVEQHHRPGGYCTSFKRKGYTFDAAADCFGAYRENGTTRKIFEDLGVAEKLKIVRPDPTVVVVTPDYEVSFWNDMERTIRDLQRTFPEEGANIADFFHFVLRSDPNSLAKIRSWTFQRLLDSYFGNGKLKAILSFPLLAIGGLPPSGMSVFIGVKLLSEFILDGGYQPEGGMQELPDALSERFRESGGEIHLSSLVRRIRVRDSRVTGVFSRERGFIPSKYVISNGDATQTFLKLLGKEKIPEEFGHKIKDMIPSISNFVLYVGLDKHFTPPRHPGTAFFFSSHYDLDRAYRAAQNGDIEGYGGYAMRISRDKSTLGAIIPAPYRNRRYWVGNKHKLSETLLGRIEEYAIPGLSEHIRYKEAASPYTLYRYTLNHKGSSYGWAGTSSQLAVPDFKKPSFIDNLYLTGHWTTLGTGISGVIYVGHDVAKMILRKERLIRKADA